MRDYRLEKVQNVQHVAGNNMAMKKEKSKAKKKPAVKKDPAMKKIAIALNEERKSGESSKPGSRGKKK